MLYLFLVAMNTPNEAIRKPIRSILVSCSFKKIQAINAVVAGIKKNTVTVLLAELFLIKNINIVKAPKDTKKIWWLIAIIKVELNSIKGSTKNNIIIRWKKHPPAA